MGITPKVITFIIIRSQHWQNLPSEIAPKIVMIFCTYQTQNSVGVVSAPLLLDISFCNAYKCPFDLSQFLFKIMNNNY